MYIVEERVLKMFELNGKYNSAKIYTDTIENSTISHIQSFLNLECLSGSKIRIMPDCYDGKGCVIGTTMTITDKVIPSVVGCDVGCGVIVVKLKEQRIDLPKLDSIIRKYVAIERTDEHKRLSEVGLEDLVCKKGDLKAVRLGFGTPGGGNHFIEIDKDEKNGDLFLVIHSGSRNLGIQVEKYYQDLAYEETKARELGGEYNDLVKALKDKLIADGRKKELSEEITKLKKKFKEYKTHLDYEVSYVSGKNFRNYIHDMKIAQRYAYLNRRVMADTILKEMKLHEIDSFTTMHNYIDLDNMIVRKGAVSAQKGEKLIIPINMRDGSLICIGKGNEDWNYSTCHGAGRLMSRSVAKSSLSVKEFKDSMKEAGVFSTCVGKGTIDEAPMAYKSMDDIVNNIGDTVDIIQVIKPIYNFKAGEEDE